MSPPDSDATLVPLLPSSLYICLVQIPIPDKFHWALYITSQNAATCHQWTEHAGARAQGKAEGYKIDRFPIDGVTDTNPDNTQNIAFIRLNAYSPSEEDMTRLFDGIFEGYATIFENRRKGVTCRTWLMRALERMRVAGCFPVLDATQVAAYEQAAIAIGKRAEAPLEVDGSNMRIVTAVDSAALLAGC